MIWQSGKAIDRDSCSLESCWALSGWNDVCWVCWLICQLCTIILRFFNPSNYFILLASATASSGDTELDTTFQKHKISKKLLRWIYSNRCSFDIEIKRDARIVSFARHPAVQKPWLFARKKWLCFELKARTHGLTTLWLYHVNSFQCDLNTESKITYWNPMNLLKKTNARVTKIHQK